MEKKGFTLIEMLIVLTVVAILVPTTFSIVFVILRQQARIYRVIETRRQGDSILTFMKERIIRSSKMTNSTGSVTYCDEKGETESMGDGTDVIFIGNNKEEYKMYLEGTNLQFQDITNGTKTALNNTDTEITSFTMRCARRSDASSSITSPLIGISYTINYKDNTQTIEEGIVELDYHTKIKLRE